MKEENDNIQPDTKRGIKHIMQCLWDAIMNISSINIMITMFILQIVFSLALTVYVCYFRFGNRKQKEQAIEEWQDEGGNVYLNGILQKSELDPDGLDLDNFKVEYRNGKLYVQSK